MTPCSSGLPEEPGSAHRSAAEKAVPWGSRKLESESESRSASMAGHEEELVTCPSCGSEKTTLVRSADRGRGTAIRRDNPGYTCFACGARWTVTISGDHDPDAPHRD